MEYLEEFQNLLLNQNYSEFLKLWEEYCTNDVVNGKELCEILQSIKESKFAGQFGQYLETALPLQEQIEEKEFANEALRLIIDLESSNSPHLANLSFEFLKEHYGSDEYFNDKIRLVGLRQGENFRGAIRNYERLSHFNEGNYVYHTAGWGTGEIMELSLIREQLVVEFENVIGKKDVPFETAFKTLDPIPKDHFLAQRFGDPDQLEIDAKKSPVHVIHLLLRDLGPKTAVEIKEELCELVIPEPEWAKWWQSARSKLKKDTLIESPSNSRHPFQLRSKELSHEERFEKAIKKKKNTDDFILTVYNFTRDFPEVFKNATFKDFLKNKLLERLAHQEIKDIQKLQLHLLIAEIYPSEKETFSVEDILKAQQNLPTFVNDIGIAGIKKKALVSIQHYLDSWPETFLQLLSRISQNSLREYIYKELNRPQFSDELKEELLRLRANPTLHPEAFIWFFQKLVNEAGENKIFSTKAEICHFFESFMVLFHKLEENTENRELVKKMYNTLTENRYIHVRNVLDGSDITFAEEFLLLITKCGSLKSHDISILQSLVEVVHPSLAQKRKQEDVIDDDILWTTQEGYTELQAKIKQIATVETVENAKEIEVARSHGDLRENSEFKFALEKRSQLQAQLKLLTEQMNRARILTREDVSVDRAGVGTVVTLKTDAGKEVVYTLLGPWDADTEANILSSQSKLAKAIAGQKVGEAFSFQSEKYTVEAIANFFDKEG